MIRPGQEIDIVLPHLRLAAKRSGDPEGPKLLAVHGWLDNAASFDPIAAYFDDHDLIAIDLPGHGRSEHRPRGAWYHFLDAVYDVICCIDTLGWHRFSLLGHSLGGAISSMIAGVLSDRVEALYLIEALGPISTPPERSLALLREAMADRAAIDAKKLRVFADLTAPEAARRMHPQMPLTDAAARLLVARGTRVVEGGHVWSSDARLTLTSAIRMTEEQVINCLDGIRCRSHAVFAEPVMPFFNEALMAARIRRVPHLMVTRMAGSHHLHMDQPEQVAKALRS